MQRGSDPAIYHALQVPSDGFSRISAAKPERLPVGRLLRLPSNPTAEDAISRRLDE
jgi:hypothetical protein